MPIHDTGDISVFSLDSVSRLALFEDVDYSIDEDQIDMSTLLRPGMRAEGQKLKGQIKTKMRSLRGSGESVSHLDLSAMALGATSYLGLIREMQLDGSFVVQKRAGLGALYERNQATAKDYKVTGTLDCDDDVASALMVLMHSSTVVDRNLTLGMTINSIPFAIPMRLQRLSTGGKRNELQSLAFEMTGRDPGTGAYPTTPAGTTSLLEKAFNSFKTPLPFAYTSKAVDGFSLAGNMTYQAFSLSLEDGGAIFDEYTFDTYGTVTAAAT